MPKEIERKFLIKDKTIISGALTSDSIKQGYLTPSGPGNSVRVRVLNGTIGVMTIKGPTESITRTEVEFPILIHEAKQLMCLCADTVEKVRYELKVDGHVWYIDKFVGLNAGLWVAEIELNNELQAFPRPDWLGKEVSFETKYYNNNLAVDPFTLWSVTSLGIHRQGEQ